MSLYRYSCVSALLSLILRLPINTKLLHNAEEELGVNESLGYLFLFFRIDSQISSFQRTT